MRDERAHVPSDPSFEGLGPAIQEPIDDRVRAEVCGTPLGRPSLRRRPGELVTPVPSQRGERFGVDGDPPLGQPVRIGVEVVAIQDHERAGRRHEPLARAGRRRRADLQHDLGTVPGEPGVVAEQQLSRRQRAARVRGVEAEAAQRLGQDRPAEERAERQERQRLRRPQRADRDDAAATRVARDEAVERGADRVRVVFDLGYGGRVAARPGRLAVGNGRLLEAAVDVHRAGRWARRVGQRPHDPCRTMTRRRRRRRAPAARGRSARTSRTARLDRSSGSPLCRAAGGAGRRSARRAAASTATPRPGRAGTRSPRCRWCTRSRPARPSPRRCRARRTRRSAHRDGRAP